MNKRQEVRLSVVCSSQFWKQQFALRIAEVIIRDFRGKQIAEENFPKAQCGRSLVRMDVDYKLAFCLALLIDKLSQPSEFTTCLESVS